MKRQFVSGVIQAAVLSVFLVVLSSAVPSLAQTAGTPAPKAHRVRLRLGIAFPTDGDTKDLVGNRILTGGVSYDLPIPRPFPALPQSAVFVYADGAGKEGTRDFRHLKMGYFGIGAGVRLYPLQKEWAEKAQLHFYFGGGVGLYFNEYRLRNERGQYFIDEKNATALGGKGFIGLDISQRFFVEADYSLPGQPFSEAIGINAGVRL